MFKQAAKTIGTGLVALQTAMSPAQAEGHWGSTQRLKQVEAAMAKQPVDGKLAADLVEIQGMLAACTQITDDSEAHRQLVRDIDAKLDTLTGNLLATGVTGLESQTAAVEGDLVR